MKICVHTCRGRKGEDEPRVFYVGAHRLIVAGVLSRWSELAHRYYEVVADDGRRFVLRRDTGTLAWELSGVTARWSR